MGNVNMEAKDVHYRGGNKPMSVEQAIKEAGSGYVLPIASAETLGGVKIGDNLTVEEDGTLNAPDPYSPFDYSTTEQATGQKWIDGRDVYCVVYDNIALTNSVEVVVDANFGNNKNVIAFNCVTRISSGTGKIQRPIQSMVAAGNDYTYPYVNIDSLNIIVHGNWTGETATLIVYYVKESE